jgi:hypothetical protein
MARRHTIESSTAHSNERATYVESIDVELSESARERMCGKASRAATELPGGGVCSTMVSGRRYSVFA